MFTQPTWPTQPAERTQAYCDFAQGQVSSDDEVPDQGTAWAVLGETARLLRDTRGNMLTDGVVLGAITIGFALEAGPWGRALRPSLVSVVSIGLLGVLLFCWVTTAALLALAGRPVLNAVSELRWKTGAPLDPRAPWLTLPPVRTDLGEWTWIRAHLLIGAARLARYRIHLADTWTCLTAVCFLVWTALHILGL